MLHPSTQKLIDRLAEMTALKQIDWAEADDGGVVYSTEGYSVRLFDSPPHVTLATEKGKTLEEATADILKETPHDSRGSYSDLIIAVVKEAARIAKGTEAAIDALLAGLSGQAPNTTRNKPAADSDPEEADADKATEEDAGEDVTSPPPVDASVPETALIDEDLSDETDLDEDDVGGAVARLAEEVNGKGSGSETGRFSRAKPEAPAAEEASVSHEGGKADTVDHLDVNEGVESPDVWDKAGPDTKAPLAGDTSSGKTAAYIPFGLGGAQVAGSEASEDSIADDDIDSELGAASTGMRLPPTKRADTSYDYDEENEPGGAPISYPLNLSGFRARIEEELSVRQTETAASEDDLAADDGETGEDEGERPDPVSPADLDAVSPPAEDEKSPISPDTELFDDGEAPEPQPKPSRRDKDKKPAKSVRRKSRFNPWS
ncbi:hypothetical protein [Henriciella marina]|uniref:hypothetical protein n=1 Tax=Henriciella marina TaxID=453851 RepID=UPI00035E62B9|nr:hypothetical protein [Henriciella marina]